MSDRTAAILPILATARHARSPVTEIIVWSLLLMGLLIVGLVIALCLKKRLTDSDVGGAQSGFTLADVREMHRNGQMTFEEFEKAKGELRRCQEGRPGRSPPSTGGRRPRSADPRFSPIPAKSISGPAGKTIFTDLSFRFGRE